MFRSIPTLVLAMFLTSCETDGPRPHEGYMAPQFAAASIGGSVVDLEQLRGGPVVLVFWASWCGPCRLEAPAVAKVAKSYGSQVTVVGVNAGENAGVAVAAARQMKMTWPVVLDPEGAIRDAYEVSAIPLVLILDAQGRVRHRNNGLPTDIHRLLDGLLG